MDVQIAVVGQIHGQSARRQGNGISQCRDAGGRFQVRFDFYDAGLYRHFRMQRAIDDVEIRLYDVIKEYRHIEHEPENPHRRDKNMVFLWQYFVEQDRNEGRCNQAGDHDLNIDPAVDYRPGQQNPDYKSQNKIYQSSHTITSLLWHCGNNTRVFKPVRQSLDSRLQNGRPDARYQHEQSH